MSKSRRRLDNSQLSIFEIVQNLQPIKPTTEGQYRCIDRLRAALRTAIKGCPLSIYQIAGEMSHLVGAGITADQIYSWTRESDEDNGRPSRHIPFEYMPAFCRVTGSQEVLQIAGEMVGLFVLPGPEALRAEIQKLDEKAREIQAEKRTRVLFLREMERER